MENTEPIFYEWILIDLHRSPSTNSMDDKINCPELARVYGYSVRWSLNLLRHDNEDAKVLEPLITDGQKAWSVCL